MKKPNFPTPYTTYSYLTRTDLVGDPPSYELHILLWMPENYEYLGWDQKPPEDIIIDPKATNYRIRLEDTQSDKEDPITCKAIAVTIDLGTPDDKEEGCYVQSFYVVSNEKPGNVKIQKKPKAKVAYIHADSGGAAPQPPTDSPEILANI